MKQTLIVAGMPRSGTTCLFRSLAGLPPSSISPKGKLRDSLPMVKTHGLAPPDSFGFPGAPKEALIKEVLWKNQGRALFVFGDPVLSVLSTIKNRFEKNHFRNCGCREPVANVDLLEKDWLNYELMFDSWYQYHLFPTICIKYETMWLHQRTIAEFTGIKFKLPEYKPRKTKCSKPDKVKVERTYSSLIEKYKAAHELTVF